MTFLNSFNSETRLSDLSPFAEGLLQEIVICRESLTPLSPSKMRKCEQLRRKVLDFFEVECLIETQEMLKLCPGVEPKDVRDEYFAVVCKTLIEQGNVKLSSIKLSDFRSVVAETLCGERCRC